MSVLCFKKILCADDTCVLVSGNDLKALINMLNNELIYLNNWFKANKLSLNTKNITFHDFSSTWIDHITHVKNKVFKGIGIMYKARQFLSKRALLDLYYAYI